MSTLKDFLKVYWPLALIALLTLIIALSWMKPAPPREIVFASGSSGGAYYAYGERYQRLLGEEGVDVILLETKGSVDNLRLLENGEADVALIQGGIATKSDAETMRSLGGLFYEPLWVFVMADYPAASFADLKQARIAIGPEGSGTRMLARQMHAEWGAGWRDPPSPLGGRAAADALLAGDIDAAMFSAAPDASYVKQLLRSSQVRLLPFPRAPALSRRSPALAPVTLLQGVVDIGANVPAQDTALIAPVAQLGIREDLHPALQSLLLSAAEAIHSDTSLLAPAGTFPDPALTDLPVTKEARRYYRNGPSALRRYFSFSMASFLERAWVLAIPLLTLMFPLVRAAPPIYRWRVRRKIYVWYAALRDLEMKGRGTASATELQSVRRELEQMQEETSVLEVPLSYNDDLYRLRSHIRFVMQILNFDDTHDEADLID